MAYYGPMTNSVGLFRNPSIVRSQAVVQLTSSSKIPSSEYITVKHSQNTGTASFSFVEKMLCCLAKLCVLEYMKDMHLH